MSLRSAVTIALTVTGVLFVVGLLSAHPVLAATSFESVAGWVLEVISSGAATLVDVGVTWAGAHRTGALALGAAVALVMALTYLPGLLARPQLDTQRTFTSAQRREGFDRADGRCEMESWGWLRCRNPAEHGDHWHPWSKGGASELGNFVAACSRCNLRKSDRVPTFWQTRRLELRRRRYFAPDVPVSAGGRTRRR